MCESDEALREVFSRYGEFVRASIRHRIDEASGENTSYAVVTMKHPDAAAEVLRQVVVAKGADGTKKTLTINPYSKKTAASSTGAMKEIGKDVAKIETIRLQNSKSRYLSPRGLSRALGVKQNVGALDVLLTPAEAARTVHIGRIPKDSAKASNRSSKAYCAPRAPRAPTASQSLRPQITGGKTTSRG